MEVEIIYGLVVAAVALFFIAQVPRVFRTRAIHATLRKSIESGQPLTPELIDKFDRAPNPGVADQRIGFVLIALGIGVIVASAIVDANDFRDLAALSTLPIFVGAALLLRVRLSNSRRADP